VILSIITSACHPERSEGSAVAFARRDDWTKNLNVGSACKFARFAYTHGNWDTAPNAELEDLIVALADHCWKGKRSEQLETKIVEVLSSLSGEPAWTCFSKLDEIVESLSADADARLAWQGSFIAE
jgi:hypothetical protein